MIHVFDFPPSCNLSQTVSFSLCAFYLSFTVGTRRKGQDRRKLQLSVSAITPDWMDTGWKEGDWRTLSQRMDEEQKIEKSGQKNNR